MPKIEKKPSALNARLLNALADSLADTTRAYIDKSMLNLAARIEDLARSMLAFPKPIDGKDGRDAPTAEELRPLLAELALAAVHEAFEAMPKPENGKDGVDGRDGRDAPSLDELQQVISELISTRVERAVSDEAAKLEARNIEDIGARFSAIPVPKDGKDGRDGRDAPSEEFVQAMVEGLVQAAVEAIPIPKDGRDGKDGVDGKSVDFEAVLAALKPMVVVQVANEIEARVEAAVKYAVDAIPKPKDGYDGKDGADGESVSLEEVLLALEEPLREKMAAIVAAIPKPRDGTDGKDGESVTVDDLRPVIMEMIAALPKAKDGRDGKDGVSVNEEEVERMVAFKVAEAAKRIPIPRDGRDGRDGRDAGDIDILPYMAENRSYPRGTWVYHNGGVLRAVRATDPTAETLEEQGWVVVCEGVAAMVVSQEDDGRTFIFSTVMTSGRQVQTRFKVPSMIYRGVYEEGREYSQGDTVTYSGSQWVALCETTDQPGTSNSWQLSVKRGRDGKSGPPDDAGGGKPKKPVRIK